jgi:hypothetical protein
MVDAGMLDGPELRNVLALWRAPERVPASPSWRHPAAALTDVMVFGEVGLFGARRGTDRQPAPIPAGSVTAPRGTAAAVPVGEVMRSDAGTLALRGPMVPRQAFPPGAERTGEPILKVLRTGFVDTGYTCRIDVETDMIMVSGPPPGIVSVGGYRFVLNELQDIVKATNEDAELAALPDALSGHRLAGNAVDRGAVQAALEQHGANPLLADAFRVRRKQASG